jgi:cytoskeleton protein RodZ
VSKTGVEKQNLQAIPAEGMVAKDSGAEMVLPDVNATDSPESSMGTRLRLERERRGWSCEDVASRLKLQASLIRRIEQDDYNGIAHAVYLRGYLSSYARLLGLPVVLAERVVAEKSEPAPLISTGTVSRSRYLLDRYSVSATYLILTGLVIGPAVWLATHGGLEQNLARTVMLDGPSATMESVSSNVELPGQELTADVAGQPEPVRDGSGADKGSSAVTAPAATTDAPPIVASMAPFASASAPAVPAPAPASAAPAGKHSMRLKLSQASWVEITDSSGEKLEYGLLEAGIERQYSSDGAMSVRIGNAQGAEIVADGKVVDLTPFRRANVAHLKVFADAGLATHVDS